MAQRKGQEFGEISTNYGHLFISKTGLFKIKHSLLYKPSNEMKRRINSGFKMTEINCK